MLEKSTKEILLQDLIETKQLLVDTFDDKEVPFVRGGAIDQFFTGKALEFQRNILLYETLLNSDVKKNDIVNDSVRSSETTFYGSEEAQ